VGTRAEEFKRDVNAVDYDVALHMVFKDKAAHDTYQDHPRHVEFIKKNKHLWKSVRVYDSYLKNGGKKGVSLPPARDPASANRPPALVPAQRQRGPQ
jgi:hypothetical protein